MVLHRRICILTLCTFFVLNGFSRASEAETKSSGESNVSLKDDIFIDDVQADAAEGSAVVNQFSEQDERWSSSGMGPDDEDAFEGSGEGSGGDAVVYKEPSSVHPIPPSPTKSDAVQRIFKSNKAQVGMVPIEQPTMRSNTPNTTPSEPHSTATMVTSTTTTPPTTTTTTTMSPPPAHIPVHPDDNKVPETPSKVPDKLPPPPPPPPPSSEQDKEDIDNDVPKGKDLTTLNLQSDDGSSSFFRQPGILAAVIGGAVVGLLCAILLVMFIVYRMRKKDEGKQPPTQLGYEQGKPYDWNSPARAWPLREKC